MNRINDYQRIGSVGVGFERRQQAIELLLYARQLGAHVADGEIVRRSRLLVEIDANRLDTIDALLEVVGVGAHERRVGHALRRGIVGKSAELQNGRTRAQDGGEARRALVE